VLGDLRYRNLDDHPAFEGQISTTEVVARHVARELAARITDEELLSLEVVLREHPDAWASYTLDLQ
ncbi:MAG: 6-carboxytetrahydropterin synthase, partial [Mobilicoccus sp.]|nr:6-carboxytetrahydropterin synthase [Mobilicoccus sp.]